MPTTVPPLQLLTPITWAHRVTARFNDAVDYSGQPNRIQRREGMLYVPQTPTSGLEVRAAQRGIVKEISFYQSGYGNFVRVQHEWYGETYATWYGHLERAEMRVGDYVNAGDVIGIAGQSGSTNQISLFFTLQHIGKGGRNYVVEDVIDPAPLLTAALTPRDEAWWAADVTIVDGTIMKPGAQFRKTWRVRNAGTTTWGAGYTVGFFADHPMGAGQSVSLPPAVPGQLVEFSVDLTAPDTLGAQRSTWQARNPAGQFFAHELFALIDVRQAEQVSGKSAVRFIDDVTLPDGQRVNAGERLRKTWRVQNDGETTWGAGYVLAFFKDNHMGAPENVALPPLAPGQQGEVSVDLVMPTAPGRHKTTWKPRDPQGRSFPAELYADIAVQPVLDDITEGTCNATVRRDTQAKLRATPAMTGQPLLTLNPSTPVRVLGITSDRDADGFRWVQVSVSNLQGFVR
ncbi:MAG: peptidoglycan DD-metalloendopeptidase family protein, partial [Armatimonadetes bacterium]|nr:peptidoglycan DD-metalloendopeptidase family protein [Anaerolineae bacterium]